MARESPMIERRRAALLAFMEAHGLTTNGWSKKAGVAESTLRYYLSGRTRTLRQATLDQLAEAAGTTSEEIFAAFQTPDPIATYDGENEPHDATIRAHGSALHREDVLPNSELYLLVGRLQEAVTSLRAQVSDLSLRISQLEDASSAHPRSAGKRMS